jgi:hypothetical protein
MKSGYEEALHPLVSGHIPVLGASTANECFSASSRHFADSTPCSSRSAWALWAVSMIPENDWKRQWRKVQNVVTCRLLPLEFGRGSISEICRVLILSPKWDAHRSLCVLTQEQKKSIERIQKRVLRLIYPNQDYDQAITETKLQTLEERRGELCIFLIKKMLERNHKLHSLLQKKLEYIRRKETRVDSQRLYNFSCKTERFKHSPLVYSTIYLYNSKLVD